MRSTVRIVLVVLGMAVAPPVASADDAPPEVTVRAAPGKGFTIATGDERYSVTVRPRFQLRDTLLVQDEHGTNEIQIRTLRLSLQGSVLDPTVGYGLQLAFGGNDYDAGNPSPILDAYVEWTALRDLQVRAGQFFVPFDRARTIRESSLQMVDRPGSVRELNLDRDSGVMVSSSDLLGTKVLGYHLFVGGGEGRNRFGGQELGPLVVARLVVRPFGTFDDDVEGDLARDCAPRLAVGVAGGTNRRVARVNGTTGADLALGHYDTLHAAADLVFKWRGFSLLAEVLLRKADRDRLAVTDPEPLEEHSRSGWGGFVQAGMMLGPTVEVTARWDELRAWSHGTDPALVAAVDATGHQLGAGANVYLNGHAFKLQGDYFFLFGDEPADGRHQVRLALDASF